MNIIYRAIFQPYAITIFVSLFLAFCNIFVPKYFLDENDFRNYRFFFNIANIFGPLLILGVDLSVGFIKLKKLIEFIKFYLIFIFFSIIILTIGESIYSEFNLSIVCGVLFLSSINLIASLFLKIGNVKSFYFLSQIYSKIIPISALFLPLFFLENFDIDISILIACLFLAMPIFLIIPFIWSKDNVSPSISVLNLKVIGLVFGTLGIDMILRIPYLLSLNSEPAITNLIDILTAFTSIILYPAMLYSRKLEVNSKMHPAKFYNQIRSGYFSISLIQLFLILIGTFSIWYIIRIGLISNGLDQILKIACGLAFCSTMISVIPNFIKLYISNSLDSYRLNLLWLGMCMMLIAAFNLGFIEDIILLSVIFMILSFSIQYAIAVKWTKSYSTFLNYGSLSISLIFFLAFIFSYLYG